MEVVLDYLSMAGEEIADLPQEGVKITEVDGEKTLVIRMPDGSAVAKPLKSPVSQEQEEKVS
jgi:hypothetical protein